MLPLVLQSAVHAQTKDSADMLDIGCCSVMQASSMPVLQQLFRSVHLGFQVVVRPNVRGLCGLLAHVLHAARHRSVAMRILDAMRLWHNVHAAVLGCERQRLLCQDAGLCVICWQPLLWCLTQHRAHHAGDVGLDAREALRGALQEMQQQVSRKPPRARMLLCQLSGELCLDLLHRPGA